MKKYALYLVCVFVLYAAVRVDPGNEKPFKRFAGMYQVMTYDQFGDQFVEADLHVYLSEDGVVWTDIEDDHTVDVDINNEGVVCILIEQKLTDGPSHIMAAVIDEDMNLGQIHTFGGIGTTHQIKLNWIDE